MNIFEQVIQMLHIIQSRSYIHTCCVFQSALGCLSVVYCYWLLGASLHTLICYQDTQRHQTCIYRTMTAIIHQTWIEADELASTGNLVSLLPSPIHSNATRWIVHKCHSTVTCKVLLNRPQHKLGQLCANR